MGWRDRPLSPSVIKAASKVDRVKGLKGEQAEAAVKVAGYIESIAREEKITKGEAATLLDELYADQGLYYSVISRCIQYDENF